MTGSRRLVADGGPITSGDLGERLRGLRRDYPSLQVSTELLRLDATLAAFRAIVSIEGTPRGSGHAACAAEASGAFVAAAEAAAVAQALLIGGFDDAKAAPTRAVNVATASPTAGDTADGRAVPPPTATTASMSGAPTGRTAAPRRATQQALTTTLATAAPAPPEKQPEASPSSVEDDAPSARPVARARNQRRTPPAQAALAAARVDTPPPPQPAPKQLAAEKTRAATPSAKQAGASTLEGLEEAWQAGQPIPAWWPASREANTKRAGRQQLARIQALGLTLEMTPQQLDRFCQLLFHRPLSELAHWQAAVLIARLDPRYPNPLEELRVGRILHPIAVGDFVPVADGQDGFIRWGDIPAATEQTAQP